MEDQDLIDRYYDRVCAANDMGYNKKYRSDMRRGAGYFKERLQEHGVSTDIIDATEKAARLKGAYASVTYTFGSKETERARREWEVAQAEFEKLLYL